MPTPYEEYQNKRSWLIDTAETPADKKRLAAQLAKLDAEYKAKYKSGTQSGHAVTNNNNHTKTVPAPKMPDNSKKPMSKDDKAARAKYGKNTWNNGYTN